MHDLDLMLQYQFDGRTKEAREISDKLENLGKDKILDPFGNNTTDVWLRHRYNRGWFLLQEGDYQNGCQYLEAGRFLQVYGSPPLYTNSPIFNPKEHVLKDKTIIISLEGGFGDEMIHVRFAKSYKSMGAKKVIIACAEELKSLFSRVEGVDEVVNRGKAHELEHDYWIPGFSAGWVAGHTFDNFPNEPYLFPLKEYVDKWKNKIKGVNDKIKVGIRWAGNPKFEHQQHRKFPVDFIMNLKKYDNLQLFSFQKDHNILDVSETIIDLQQELETWEDTIAAIENLDLMITSCTSIAHLSSALGKETWVVVPALPYHTWTWKTPHSNTTPYYKNSKIYRQEKYGKWNNTWQKLYKDLEQKFNLFHIDMPNCDKEYKKINLGCGIEKYENFINVDKEELFKPDEVVDLNDTKWPWKDNEFCYISAKNILQFLESDVNALKEMYRISENGATWEIKIPNPMSVLSDSEIGTKRKFSLNYFLNLDQKNLMDENIVKNNINNLFAYKEKIDVEIVDISLQYHTLWKKRLDENLINLEQLNEAQKQLWNIVDYCTILMQVHKAPRYSDEEFEEAIKKVVNNITVLKEKKIGINKILDA